MLNNFIGGSQLSFKDKGIKAFSGYTNTISSNNIRDSINQDWVL